MCHIRENKLNKAANNSKKKILETMIGGVAVGLCPACGAEIKIIIS